MAAFVLAMPAFLAASQPWSKKDPAGWTAQDVNRVLEDSPWAQPTGAIFGIQPQDDPAPQHLPGAAEAGLPGQQQSHEWDGGVGRNDRYNVPTLTVTVRWDSALPERLALQRQQAFNKSSPAPYSADEAAKDYIITVTGLAAAGHYNAVGMAETKSSSDDSVDTNNPEAILEGLMSNARLLTQAGAIRPENAKLDASSGAIHLFFPRTRAIMLSDKEVVFETRFGSLSVSKRFRLKDMVYSGKLEL